MIHIFEPSWFLLSGRENPLYDILFTSMANWLPRPIFKSKVSGNLWARSNKIFVKPKKIRGTSSLREKSGIVWSKENCDETGIQIYM